MLLFTNSVSCTLDGFTATAAGKAVGIVVRGVAYSTDGSKPTQVWKKLGDTIKFPALQQFGDAPHVIVFQLQGTTVPTVNLGQGITVNARMNCGSSLSGSTVTIGDLSGEMGAGYNFAAIPTIGVATLHINGGVYKVDGMVLVDGSPAVYSYSAAPLGPNGGYGTAGNVYDFFVQTIVQ